MQPADLKGTWMAGWTAGAKALQRAGWSGTLAVGMWVEHLVGQMERMWAERTAAP